ncbi:MAG: hypothetical protein LAO03_16185 [Acidobacteriia bacterium]|nr:hypothetical protein [Terriglobia bacterium]
MLALLLPVSANADTLLKTISVGANPGQIVVNPSGHLAYVVNQGGNSVSVIDTAQLKVKATLTVGTAPAGIAVNPVSNEAYVANTGVGTVTAISGTTVLATWTVGGTPSALVVDSVLNQLYVMDTSRNQVEVLNATTGALLATLSTTLTPKAMALNIATHAVFVACSGSSGSVVVIDGTKNQVATTVAVAAGSTSISVDPVTNVVVVESPSTNTHSAIYAASGYGVQTETLSGPLGSAYATGLFYVTESSSTVIGFADGATGLFTLGNAFVTNLLGGAGIAVNPTTNQMATLYSNTDVVYLIDLLNPLFTQNYHELTAGNVVAGVAFDPLTHRLFVTNSTDKTVSVFDISPRELVDAYEGDHGGNSISYNYIDTNPATGTVYTLRVNNLFATNEAAAGAGDTGLPQNNSGVTTIPLASVYSGAVAVNAATNKIYVGDSVGNMYSVDGQTNVATLLTSVPSNADVRSLVVDNATNQVIAWDYSGAALYVLDGSTDALLKTVPIASSALTTLQLDPARNLVYAPVSGAVYVVDPAAGTVVTTIGISGQPLGSALNPARSRLYVITGLNVAVIDTSTNTVMTTITLPNVGQSIAVNPVSGNFYVGVNGTAFHVYEYSATNALLTDFSSAVYPVITGVSDIRANPLTDSVYVGSDSGTSTAMIAAIDERTKTVSGIAPLFDVASHALAVDLGNGLLASTGYSYTNLFFPTTDVGAATPFEATVTEKGVVDSLTITTKPIFRTRNPTPRFSLAATNSSGNTSPDMVPKHGFYQVDGWQGTWKAVTLTAKPGSQTSSAKIKLSTQTTGRHILYFFAGDGDLASVQAGLATGNPVANSPVVSPIGSAVFTVEK